MLNRTLLGKRLATALVAGLLLSAIADGAAAQRVTLRGTVVVPDQVLPDAVVVVDAGRIVYVGPQPRSAQDVETNGVLFPGLIDLHNHLTWNVFPRWEPGRLFANRYEWQEHPDYLARVRNPHYAIVGAVGCEMNMYAEVKAIVHGATSVVGGLTRPGTGADKCILGLARNLDLASELGGSALNGEILRNQVFPLELQSCAALELRDLSAAKPCSPFTQAPQAAVVHLAEGTEAASRREFRMADSSGLVRSGVTLVHGIPLTPAQHARMAASFVGMVWSPRSNLALYGATADVRSAKASKIVIAIGPDWSPTGGEGMLDELAFIETLRRRFMPFAGVFSDSEMVQMATTHPAKLSGYGTQIGRLERNYAADLVVMRPRPVSVGASGTAAAYQALLRQSPQDLLLVMIGGRPVYGTTTLMGRLMPTGAAAISLSVCGHTRLLHDPVLPPLVWQSLTSRLDSALAKQNTVRSPLVTCP